LRPTFYRIENSHVEVGFFEREEKRKTHGGVKRSEQHRRSFLE